MSQTGVWVSGPLGSNPANTTASPFYDWFVAEGSWSLTNSANVFSQFPLNYGGGVVQFLTVLASNTKTNTIQIYVHFAAGTGNTTVTVPASASTATVYTDTTHSDTVTDGQQIEMWINPGASTATASLMGITVQGWVPSGNGYSQVGWQTIAGGQSVNSTNAYATVGGRLVVNTSSEPPAQQQVTIAGVMDYLQLSCYTTGVGTVMQSRVATAAGNMVVTTSSSSVSNALYVDTTHSDSIAAATLVDLNMRPNTALTSNYLIGQFRLKATVNGNSFMCAGGVSSVAGSGVVTFFPFAGTIGTQATENNACIPVCAAGTISLTCVRVSANTSGATYQVRTRINATYSTQIITVAAGATGAFTDVTHTDAVTTGNKITLYNATNFVSTINTQSCSIVTNIVGTTITNQSANVTQAETVAVDNLVGLIRGISQTQTVNARASSSLRRGLGVTQAQVVSVSAIRSVKKLLSVVQAQVVKADYSLTKGIRVVQSQIVSLRKVLSETISSVLAQVINAGKGTGYPIQVTQAQSVSVLRSLTHRIAVTQVQVVRAARGFGRQVMVTQGQIVTALQLRVRLFGIGLTQAQVIGLRQSYGRFISVTQTQVVRRLTAISRRIDTALGQIVRLSRTLPRRVTVTQVEVTRALPRKAFLLPLRVDQAQTIRVSARRTLRKLISVTQGQVANLRTNIKSVVVSLLQAQTVRVTQRRSVFARVSLGQIVRAFAKVAFRRSITEYINANDNFSSKMKSSRAILEFTGARALSNPPWSSVAFRQETVVVSDLITGKLFECPPVEPYPQPIQNENWWLAVHSPANPGGPTPGLPDWLATQPWWIKNHSTKS